MKALVALVATAFLAAPALAAEDKVPPLFIYGAKIGKKGDEGCRDYRGDCILLVDEDKPVVVVSYTKKIDERKDSAAVIIDMSKSSKDTKKKLAELSKRFLGKRLAVLAGNTVINTPEVRNELNEPILQLSFGDKRSLDIVKKALGGGDK